MNQEKPKIFRCNNTFIQHIPEYSAVKALDLFEKKFERADTGKVEKPYLLRVSSLGFRIDILPTFNRLDRFAQAFASGILGKPHNRIFDPGGIGDLAKNEAFFLAGGLYMHVAEVEDCRNNALHGGGDILDAGKVEFAYLADE